MKRIAILGTAYPFRGGIAAFNEQLAKQFIAEANEVKIFTFTSQYPSILFPGKTQFSSDPAPNIDIERCFSSTNPLTWTSCAKSIISFNPEIIIVPFWIPFMAPALGTIIKKVKRKNSAKVISIVHNLLPHEMRIGDKQLSEYFFDNIDGAVSLSKDVYKKVVDFADIKSVYSPHPVYNHYGNSVSLVEACQKLNFDVNKKRILFFGLIRKYKGVDLLIEAMQIVNSKLKDIELVIAGEFYDDKEKYIQLIEKYNIEKVVKVVDGFIPDSDLKFYFSSANLVVFPYRTATQSGVTQVAYHFNKPMLVTKVGGLPDLVAENIAGLHCLPNAESIADQIINFFENNMEEVLITTLIEEKKKFEWNAFTKSIYDLCE